MTRPLIVGVGNPLRGDDGVGPVVVEHLATGQEAAGAALVTVHQLTPELAEDVAAATLVIIIDADAKLRQGELAQRPVAAGAGGPLGHHLAPSALVALAERLYGPAPPVVAVAVGAAVFDGEGLSPPVAAAVPAAAALVARLLERDAGAVGTPVRRRPA